MKTIILNGSPRKNWNTAQILKEVRKGAESVNDEVEYFDLYDFEYNGCRSCMACKRVGNKDCKCYWKDGLSPVLDKIMSADRLITGSPVYYSEPTGGFRSFMERLTFPALSYNDYSSTFKGKLDVVVFLTMNTPLEGYNNMLQSRMAEILGPFHFMNGETRIIPVCDTLQVKDYSKYEMHSFSEEHKKKVHDEEFPKILELAYKIGSRSE